MRLGETEPDRRSAIVRQAAYVAAQGVDYLQIREPDLPAADLAAIAREILVILGTHGGRTKLLIHSRADIAIATGAHGVHLPSHARSLTPTQVRSLYDSVDLPKPSVSASCHTLDEVAQATSSNPDEAPDLILFGPVFEKVVAGFESETLVSSGVGLERLHAACRIAAPIPVLALGGVTQFNAPACLAAGAAGIAAIRLFG